jgi:hypothetical protein
MFKKNQGNYLTTSQNRLLKKCRKEIRAYYDLIRPESIQIEAPTEYPDGIEPIDSVSEKIEYIDSNLDVSEESVEEQGMEKLAVEHDRLRRVIPEMINNTEIGFTDEEISIIAWQYMGFNETQIGEYLDITQQAVSKKLKKIRKKAESFRDKYRSNPDWVHGKFLRPIRPKRLNF